MTTNKNSISFNLIKFQFVYDLFLQHISGEVEFDSDVLTEKSPVTNNQ